MEDKKVLLSVQDLVVKFHVRGRVLTAIRGISLDIYENESIAIVGESGSGKSVFTKTFAGMLDSNGFIDQGNLFFDDDSLAKTNAKNNDRAKKEIAAALEGLNRNSHFEAGGALYREMECLKADKKANAQMNAEEAEAFEKRLSDLQFNRTELFNKSLAFDGKTEKAEIRETEKQIKELDAEIKQVEAEKEAAIRAYKTAAKNDTSYNAEYLKKMEKLSAEYAKAIAVDVTEDQIKRNEIIAREIYLSTARYGTGKRKKCQRDLVEAFKQAQLQGENLSDANVRNQIFDTVTFRVEYLSEDEETIYGNGVINLAKIKDAKDWSQVRGRRIATIFQDPMTSLNPIITIGKQITSIILKHQECSEVEARRRAIELMKKVGIPNAENRFDDYPFQYSGGMRQRIVIAIALSCQPKILICDEPTTALDVTIQAQILKLLKDLQKEFNYTIVFITHDLGVVANVADRVAVLYAGQVIEVGKVEEVFYDPRHPYTWALLSSLPQLAKRNTKLYSITGTPPSLYNKIVGDPFAPRNPYCLKIDTIQEPPMFQVTETHFAKTWLEDPRAPKVEKPEIIKDIHSSLIEAFNI